MKFITPEKVIGGDGKHYSLRQARHRYPTLVRDSSGFLALNRHGRWRDGLPLGIGDIVKVIIPLFRDPKHWRARAAETRATAEQFADPESKRLILWIADEYEILAERTDADLNKLSPKNSN